MSNEFSIELSFSSFEEAVQAIHEHEIATSSKFSTYKSSRNFGKIDLQQARHVYWYDTAATICGRQEFTGVPFSVLGQKFYDCQFGRDRRLKARQKRVSKQIEEDHDYGQGNKFLAGTRATRKIDCPARVRFRELVEFPEYKADGSIVSKIELSEIAGKILCRIHAGEQIEVRPKYILCLPGVEAHKCHSAVPPRNANMDPRIVSKIQELTRDGVKNVKEMKTHIKNYMQEISPSLPNSTDGSFLPEQRLIFYHMYKARRKLKLRVFSKKQHKERDSSENQIKAKDSSNQMKQKDSSNQLKEKDSSNQMKEKGSSNQLQAKDCSNQLKEKDSSNQIKAKDSSEKQFKDKEVVEALHDHEMTTHSRFSAYKSSKNFGKIDLEQARKVHWFDKRTITYGRQEFTGVPFSVLGHKSYDCYFGKDRKAKAKRDHFSKQLENDHDYGLGTKFVSGTKSSLKKDCPAQVLVRELIEFPAYKGKQSIDPRVAGKIQELTRQGVKTVKEIRTHIKNYVKEILPQGTLRHPANARFYPPKRTILKHMYAAKEKQAKEKDSLEDQLQEEDSIEDLLQKIDIFEDQENLQEKVRMLYLHCLQT